MLNSRCRLKLCVPGIVQENSTAMSLVMGRHHPRVSSMSAVILLLHLLLLEPVQSQTKYSAPYTTDCILTRSGREYAGSLNVTESGRTCQAWSSNAPHANYYIRSTNYPEGSALAAGNKCRNPGTNYNHSVWCYTTAPNIRWENCRVPLCECVHPSDPLGILYEGERNITRSGKQCIRWKSTSRGHPFNQSSYFPDTNIGAARNYCRNPNASRPLGPWCYTNSSNLAWEYCSIPVCNFSSSVFFTTSRSTSASTRVSKTRKLTMPVTQTTRTFTDTMSGTETTQNMGQATEGTISAGITSTSSQITSSPKFNQPTDSTLSTTETSREKSSTESTMIRSSSLSTTEASHEKSSTKSTTIRSSVEATVISTMTIVLNGISSHAEDESHAGFDNSIAKIVVPVLGGIIVLGIIIAVIIYRKRLCRNIDPSSWKPFTNNYRREMEMDKTSQTKGKVEDTSRNPTEYSENPSFKDEQPSKISEFSEDLGLEGGSLPVILTDTGATYNPLYDIKLSSN